MKTNGVKSFEKLRLFLILLITTISILGCSSLVNITGYSKDQIINNPQKVSYLEFINAKYNPPYSYSLDICIAPAIYKNDISFSTGSTAKVFCSIGDCYNHKTEECTDSYHILSDKKYFILKPDKYTMYIKVTATTQRGNDYVHIPSILRIDELTTEAGNTTSIIFSPQDVGSKELKYNIYKRKKTVYDINKKELIQIN